MVEMTGTIKNSAVRVLTTAAAAFSIATLLSGAVIGFVKPKDETAQKIGCSTALAGLGCGVLLGLVSGSKGAQRSGMPVSASTDRAASVWTDWRNFVVVRKVKESEEITSFYLKPQDQAALPNFQPGQFLTIKLDIPGQHKPIIRTYSLSDHTELCDYYRLSIKREPMPKGLDVPAGLASNFMHDQVQEGSIIQAKPPSGKFFLDIVKSSPVILISNGVGITPMISMVKACSRLNPDRPLWFIHGARDGTFHAFRDEVLEIAQQNTNLHLHFRYSRPQPDDAGQYHSTGYVDTALIQAIAQEIAESHSADKIEYYLCGSPPFLQALRDGLKASEIPDHRVFFEVFGGAKAVDQSQPAKATNGKVQATEPMNDAEEVQSAEIVFAKSKTTLTWQVGDGTILEFAEANGLNPAYSCRQGICLTCMCQLQEGEVNYVQQPIGTPDEGSVLICISQPNAARVVLDL